MADPVGAEVPTTQKAWSGGAEVDVVIPGVQFGTDATTATVKVWKTDVIVPPSDPDLPTAPTNLRATSITGTAFVLTWDAAETSAAFPITEYDIFQDGALIDTVTSDAAVVVGTVENAVASTLSELVSGLTAGTIYQFTVSATNAAGESDQSAMIIVQTVSLPVATAPNAPAALNAASVSDTGVTLSWPAATLPVGATAVQGYRVYSAGSTLVKTVGANVLSTVLAGLFPQTTYNFTVRAFNSAGESQPSPVRTVTTLATTPPPPPAPPYGDTTSVVTAINAAGTVAAVATALGPIATYYAFTFSFKTGASTPPTGPGWTGLTTADLPLVKAMATYYAQEFAKYPKGFVVDSALNQVVLAKVITFDGNAAISYAYQQSVYEGLPSTAVTDPDNWRRVVHHEFWHVVDGAFPAIKASQEDPWRAANGSGYLYTTEGGTARPNLPDGHPLGFIDAYAQTSYDEDRAQIHSALMAQPRYSQLQTWMGGDPGLTTKVNLIKQASTTINSYMSGTYWDTINPPVIGAVVPNAPTSFRTASAPTTTAVALAWNAATVPSGGSAVQGYRVYEGATQRMQVGNVTSANLTGLTPDTTYTLTLRAFNADGSSANSNALTITTQADVTPPPTGGYFKATAYWNRPLPANAPIVADSAARLQTLFNDNPSRSFQISMNAYSMPTYYAKASDPIFFVKNVTTTAGNGGPDQFTSAGSGIKMPAARKGNAEGAMTVIDRTSWTNPVNGRPGGLWVAGMHMFGGGNWNGSTYQADGGSIFYITSNGLDPKVNTMYPNNTHSDDARNGGSARGCPNSVRRGFAIEDYKAGGIFHLVEGFINNTGNTPVYPWTHAESGNLPGWPEGTRMRLKAGVNLNLAGPTGSAGWMLAKCLQSYGVVNGDQAGNTAQIKAEASSLLNGGAADWAGTNLTINSLSGFPFTSAFWEVIQPGYEP